MSLTGAGRALHGDAWAIIRFKTADNLFLLIVVGEWEE
jgi:hypothetical protein